MKAGRVKFVAVLLLAAAIAALALALTASEQASRIQGPSALVVVDDREVWIGVDDELWRVSRTGQLRERLDTVATGLPGPPANLVRHPSGAIVATVRDDPTLYFLDAAQARVTRRVLPRWPAELAPHGGRAISLAFQPTGRVAIATGGGHAVALFGADGGFIARSATDTYKFSNGLWWEGNRLWTTDTNRFRLKRLDGATLALREERRLPGNEAGAYLGPARALGGADGAVRAALIRYRNSMITGRIVAIDQQFHETGFVSPAVASEPRDVDWLGGELLASDGATLAVWHWQSPGLAPAMFGDADLRERWSKLPVQRATLQQRYRIALAIAIGTFAVGFALAVWAERLGRSAGLQHETPIDLSRLGTPRLPTRELVVLNLRAWGWWLLVAALPLPLVFRPTVNWLRSVGGAPLALTALAGVAVVALVSLPLIWLHQKRLATRGEFEPLCNAFAMRKLRGNSALGAALRDSEQVLETFSWMRPTLHWAVLTDERLLVFVATLFDVRLESHHALTDIAAASAMPGALKQAARGGRAAHRRWRWHPGGWLEMLRNDGEIIEGAVSAATVAERVAQRLQRGHPAARPQGHVPTPATAAAAAARGPSAATAAIASALIPGLGQWMQRRRASALLMFVPWALAVVVVFVPVAWTLYGPRAEVAPTTIAYALGLALLDAAVAAWDAWRMGARPAR